MVASTITTSRTASSTCRQPERHAMLLIDREGSGLSEKLICGFMECQSERRGGEGGIRTLGGALGHLNRLAGGPIRPLWHLPGSIGQVAWYCTASRDPHPTC